MSLSSLTATTAAPVPSGSCLWRCTEDSGQCFSHPVAANCISPHLIKHKWINSSKCLHPGPLFRLQAMPTRLDLLSHVSRQAFQVLNFSLNGLGSCSEIYSCPELEVIEQFSAALIGVAVSSPSSTQKKLFSLRPSSKR